MSVNSEITRLTSARNTIRQKMISAGQAISTDDLTDLATKLNVINTSDANATSEDILVGKTAYVNGIKITGTLSYMTSSDLADIVSTRNS